MCFVLMVVMNVPRYYGCDGCASLFLGVMNGPRSHSSDECALFLWL